MNKTKCITLIVSVLLSLALLSACEQSATKNFGGSMTLELAPNQKLEMITWKDDSLWYLTRPMTEDDIPETHTFQQSSEFGVFEGTITIVETKKD